MQHLRLWPSQPRQVARIVLTLGAIALSIGATVRVALDFAELRQVDAVVRRLDTALTGDDLTPIGDALRQANQLRDRLTSQAAKQTLGVQLAQEQRELAFELQSAVPIDAAKQFIEERQYARARRLGQTVQWLANYLSTALEADEAVQLQLDSSSNLRFFEEIEGWIALRRFRASPGNRTSELEAQFIRANYPAIYAENIEVFQGRAQQKFTNGLRLLESGDLQGALQSLEVAVLLDPSQPEYRQRYEELKDRLNGS
ncbi:hypothetical protein [Synechococcus sp. PCC 7336]|uniref:hypothetical protein n=1 Tax=Synechococcus sp. PCC 7336 TaxID=195250 RepID=UPI000382420E|nr:hypothetical protein [Synechococcus sp. PCC 7336]